MASNLNSRFLPPGSCSRKSRVPHAGYSKREDHAPKGEEEVGHPRDILKRKGGTSWVLLATILGTSWVPLATFEKKRKRIQAVPRLSSYITSNWRGQPLV